MVAFLEVRADASQIASLGNLIGALGKNAPAAIARAINHTGDKAKTQMIRALTTQTGLQRKVIVKALKVSKASGGNLTYTISSHGGDIGLKYFAARETRAGVSAAPFGHRQVFAGTFMKGGRFPNRVAIGQFNGQVMQRDGAGRLPVSKVKSGVFIPVEMTRGATAEAFKSSVATDLPDRLMHEMLRALGA